MTKKQDQKKKIIINLNPKKAIRLSLKNEYR